MRVPHGASLGPPGHGVHACVHAWRAVHAPACLRPSCVHACVHACVRACVHACERAPCVLTERAPCPNLRLQHTMQHTFAANAARHACSLPLARARPHPSQPSPLVRSRRSIDLTRWKCFIPGRANTEWEGGFFPLTMEFSDDYPTKPPKVGGPEGQAVCALWDAYWLGRTRSSSSSSSSGSKQEGCCTPE